MSKNRRRESRSSSKIPSARNSPTAGARESTSPSPILHRLALPIFLALLIGYLLIFITAPAPDRLEFTEAPVDSRTSQSEKPPQLSRIDMLLWLILDRPGQLAGDWTGGEAGGFSLLDRAGVLAAAGVILLSALAVGWLLLDLVRVTGVLGRLDIFVFSLAVGLNALSLLALSVGLTGLLKNVFAYVVPLAVVMALSAWRYASGSDASGRARLVPSRSVDVARQEPRPPMDWLPRRALWLAAPFVLVIFAGAILPPREFDVREYHLQAPKEWFQEGRITFMPHNVYANMPLGPQILALPAMAMMPGEHSWWWGALAGKIIIASYAVIAMLALFAAGRRFFNTTAGVAAALIYISIPWIAFVSIESYIDGALACNLFLAVYAAMIWQAHQPEAQARKLTAPDIANPRSRFGLVLLAGFLAGAAVGCKYTAVVFVAIPLAVWIAVVGIRSAAHSRARHDSSNEAARTENRWPLTFAASLLAILAGCGLWLGKNWVLASNPTYPLAYSVFGGETRTDDKNRQWTKAHAVPRNEHDQRYSIGHIGSAVRQLAFDNDWPSPILIPLAALAFFVPWHRRRVLTIFGWLALIIALWFLLTHRIDRFWIPALPFAALLAGAGVTWRSDLLWRFIVMVVLLGGLAWNLLVVVEMLAPPKLLADLSSLQVDPHRIHPAKIHLNEHVAPGKQVLLVGDAEPFDLQMPTLYNTCFDDSIFERLVRDKSPAERTAALREQSISHIYVHWGEIDRYRRTYGYTDYVTPQIFAELIQQKVLGPPKIIRHPQMGAVEIYPVAKP